MCVCLCVHFPALWLAINEVKNLIIKTNRRDDELLIKQLHFANVEVKGESNEKYEMLVKV